MLKKRGFTLAEVLITLSVIGAVAAIGLPMLFSNTRPNKEMIMLKKAYYLTARNINEMINDDQHYDGIFSLPGNDGDFRGINYSAAVDANNAMFCVIFSARMNLLAGAPSCDFTTVDNIHWHIESNRVGGTNNIRTRITVDVNGEDEGDSCGFYNCEDGEIPDTFTITVNEHGQITLGGDQLAEAYLKSNSTSTSFTEFDNDINKVTPSNPGND